MGINDEPMGRARQYCQRNGLLLGDSFGFGVHGIVFATECQGEKGPSAVRSAIKAHREGSQYARERDVYLRLKEHGVTTIRGCHVPRLLRFDDALWIIEMTVVSRPFVLDFAGAFLDEGPDFSDEVLAEWRTEKQEQFGGRWREAQAILRSLEQYGVFMVDVNPGNISFSD